MADEFDKDGVSEADMQDIPQLRFLKVLVTVLAGVMIAGLIVLIALIVISFRSQGPTLPDTIALPAGETATAFTAGRGWYAVVTGSDEIVIFDSEGRELKRIAIED
ncbi:DUF6476 family protein [Pseudooceanicola sp. C21-150M6]|uniref:DUF6476 family protein n=1 Tax=Pseudooceanicola sp. C21-150M6 TaxID=3434355 RepID=UPI003D7F56FA